MAVMVGINKMRATTILLLVMTLGLIVTGCSKAVPTMQTDTQSADTANAADISIDTVSANPDIGTLDDLNVSDGIPQ
jgi:hypothetical protein